MYLNCYFMEHANLLCDEYWNRKVLSNEKTQRGAHAPPVQYSTIYLYDEAWY